MHKRPAAGYTYLGVLFIVSVLAMTAAAASVVWHVAKQRDDERELVFVGQQFAAAIERYRNRVLNPDQPYPYRLEELLHDDRGVVPQRHLRRLYVDPMTGDAKWGLIRVSGGGIVGVHSLSERRPYPRNQVVAGYMPPVASSYQGWRFVAPSALVLLAAQAPLPAGASSQPLPSVVEPAERSGRGEVPSGGDDESPTEPAVPRVARPTPEDLRSRTPEACDRIVAHDEQICQQLADAASGDAFRACRDSAIQRSVACALGTAGRLPALVRSAP